MGWTSLDKLGTVCEPPPSVILAHVGIRVLTHSSGNYVRFVLFPFENIREVECNLRVSQLITKVREKKYLIGVKMCIQLAP